MSPANDSDGQIERWLRVELDAVPEPKRAIDEAIRASATVPQRKPRRGLRAWLFPRRTPATGPSELPEPEMVIWAGATNRSSAAVAPAARPQHLPLAAAVTALGIAVVMGLGFVFGGLGPLQGQPLTAGGADVEVGALVLEDPLPAGRDIVVAADGSGHFWTIGDAISQATDGDRIKIMPGTYDVSAVVTKDISISGQGEPGDVIVRPDGDAPLDPSAFDYEPIGGDTQLSEYLPDGWRYVFSLVDSDVRLSDMTILGAEVGTAILIDGGAPILERLVVDPDGQETGANPGKPHESVAFRGASRGMLRDSTASAMVSIVDASTPTLSGNTLVGSCLIIDGPGSDPGVIDNRIEFSRCPRFSVWVLNGASPKIESNDIAGDRVTDGIRILGPGTAPTILGNDISGGDSGIWVGDGAAGLISRNNVLGARTGITIIGAAPIVSTNGFFDNEVGVSIDVTASPQFTDNELCRNALEVEIPEGATISIEGNDICKQGSEEAAVPT
jgi:hypothetical protein